MSDIKKVVLAYSGGLDTSVILKWLQDNYDAEVVTFTADIGQGEELGALKVIEVGQAIKRQLFGLREDGQPLAAGGAHWSVRHAIVPSGEHGRNFPYNVSFRESNLFRAQVAPSSDSVGDRRAIDRFRESPFTMRPPPKQPNAERRSREHLTPANPDQE